MLVQEILHSMTYSIWGGKLMGLKVDMEKAYDHMNWEFIELVLLKFGFQLQFVS